MAKLTCNQVCKEILEIRSRILEKKEEYNKKFEYQIPLKLEKKIFELIFDINKKVSAYHFVNDFAVNEFSFLYSNLNINCVIKKVEQSVDILRENYYFELAETVRKVIIDLTKRKYMNVAESKLLELKESINVLTFIKNHAEYVKVSELIYYAKELENVNSRNLEKNLYQLVGIKAILIEYEKCFRALEKVKDNSLKRAVMAYVEDCLDSSYLYKIMEIASKN